MNAQEQHAELTRLLRAGIAAVEAEHGGSPIEWPMLLAQTLHVSVNKVLGSTMTISHLIALFVQADVTQRSQAPGADWPSWYAGWLQERYRHNRPGLGVE
jgi:hypothetical protein